MLKQCGLHASGVLVERWVRLVVWPDFTALLIPPPHSANLSMDAGGVFGDLAPPPAGCQSACSLGGGCCVKGGTAVGAAASSPVQARALARFS